MPVRTAVILAAGRGSRMAGLTRDRPKCLLPLAGKTLLAWQLAALATAGMEQVCVVRGYLGRLLAGSFRTLENPRWAETNMVRTLECAADLLASEPCVVAYADIVYHPDHVRALAAAEQDLAISYDELWEPLWRLRFPDPLADAETFAQDRGVLTDIGRKPSSLAEIHGQFMGLVKCAPAGFAIIREHLASLPAGAADALDVTALLAGLLRKGVRIGAVPVQGRWLEADRPEDLARYEQVLAAPPRGFAHDFRPGATPGVEAAGPRPLDRRIRAT